jgi:hypothetical protein
MSLRTVLQRALWFGLAALASIACGSERAPEPAPVPGTAERVPAELSASPAAEDQRPSSGPPAVAFVAPSPWQSKRDGVPPIDPPPLPTWRVLVTQNEPLQAKTPLWQRLPPAETIELAMPPQSGFRCVVTPLQVTAEANDFGTKLKGWLLARSLLCSSDGFRAWTEHVHSVALAAEGSPPEASQSGILLRERDAAAGVRQTNLLVRTDEEVRAATTGPPRILPGVKVDVD